MEGSMTGSARGPVTGVGRHAERLAADSFKDVMGRFPTGVVVVTTRWRGGHQAMTASSLTSVSLEPPLVLFCVERRASFHDAVLGAGAWAVSMLSEEQSTMSDRFAGRASRTRRDFVGLEHSHGRITGAALLRGALATIECRTWATYAGGDHTIVVGRVLAASVSRPDGRPLTYWRGRYRSLNPTDPAPRPHNPDNDPPTADPPTADPPTAGPASPH